MIGSYLSVLEESLKKKIAVLTKIQEANLSQSELLKEEKLDVEQFDKYVDQKDVYIKELEKLDEGFDALFERVKEPLTAQKDVYKTEIGFMQATIRSLTDKSAELEAMEQRNKKMVESRMAESRQAIRQSKLGSQAAMQYYQRMNRINTIDPQLMDKKS